MVFNINDNNYNKENKTLNEVIKYKLVISGK